VSLDRQSLFVGEAEESMGARRFSPEVRSPDTWVAEVSEEEILVDFDLFLTRWFDILDLSWERNSFVYG